MSFGYLIESMFGIVIFLALIVLLAVVGIVIFLALIVLLAVVLIKAKRKRREKMKEQHHELFNGPDDGSKN